MPDLTVSALFDELTANGRKRCCTCREIKPLEVFSRLKAGPLGLGKQCRSCRNVAAANYRNRNPERCYSAQLASMAKKPDLYRKLRREGMARKYAGDVVAARRRARDYYAVNSERILQWHKERRRANPEPYRLATRRAKAFRRAIDQSAASVRFTQQQLEARMAYWGNRCYLCRGPWEAIEHVKPYAAGGANLLANIRPACTSCNSSKHKSWHGPAWAMSLIDSRLSP